MGMSVDECYHLRLATPLKRSKIKIPSMVTESGAFLWKKFIIFTLEI